MATPQTIPPSRAASQRRNSAPSPAAAQDAPIRNVANKSQKTQRHDDARDKITRRNIAHRSRQTHAMKILREKRHHAPLNHRRKQHNFPQPQPGANRQEPRAHRIATQTAPAIAPQANRTPRAARSETAQSSAHAPCPVSHRPDASIPRGTARWSAQSKATPAPQSRLPPGTKAENSNPRAMTVSKSQLPRPPARSCSANPHAGKAAARTNKAPPSTPRAKSAAGPAPCPRNQPARSASQNSIALDRKSQPAAHPKKKNHQRPHVQSRNNQHVIRGRLLKRQHHARIHEAAIAQKHRAQNRAAFGCSAKRESSRARKLPRARASRCKIVGAGRSTNCSNAPLRSEPDQINFLPRQKATKIKRARIQKIPRRPRLHQRLHAITRAQSLRRPHRAFVRIKIHAQAAADAEFPRRPPPPAPD